MAKIYVAVAGEGRGHAIRSLVVIKYLAEQKGHTVTVFTGGMAFDVMRKSLPKNVGLQYIPVPRFGYSGNGVNYFKTFIKNFYYLVATPFLSRECACAIRAGRPDLVISDFEPLFARAAKTTNTPLLTLDHQQVIAHSDLKELPWWLRLRARWISIFIRLMTPYQDFGISTAFFRTTPRKKYKHIVQIGSVIRDGISSATPTNDGTILVYLKPTFGDRLLRTVCLLASQGYKLVIYGLDEEDVIGEHLAFKKVSDEGFIEDLIKCSVVICGAGNQLISEAHYLGKPVFAIPSRGETEQLINAHYVAHTGCGIWMHPQEVTIIDLLTFIESSDTYRECDRSFVVSGNQRLKQALDSVIDKIVCAKNDSANSVNKHNTGDSVCNGLRYGFV